MNVNMETLGGIVDACGALEVDVKLRTDYSGRRMAGAVCVGFVSSNPVGVGAAIAWFARESLWEDLQEFVTDACYDDMGSEWIIYFPSYVLEDGAT